MKKKILCFLLAASSALCLLISTTACGPAAAHVHEFERVAAKAATCAQDGNREYWHCKSCEKNYSDAEGKTEITATVVPATGEHTYGEWQITEAATCGAAGSKKQVCTVCNDEVVEAIPATGEHTYGEWQIIEEPTCDKAGSRKKVCTVCDDEIAEIIPATGEHTYGEWQIIADATCGEAGSKKQV